MANYTVEETRFRVEYELVRVPLKAAGLTDLLPHLEENSDQAAADPESPSS